MSEIRPAATVVLVRPAASGGWDTYLVRRSARSPVLADLWVFPGGTVRSDDLSQDAEALDPDFPPGAAHALLSRPPGEPAATANDSRGYFVAAARELFEEAGVLLARDENWPAPSQRERDADGRHTRETRHIPTLGMRQDAESYAELRREVEAGGQFAAAISKIGTRLDLRSLTYYAHWITPLAVPQRFDTRFFLAQLPAGQSASPSAFEMAEGTWISAEDALQRSKSGDIPLHFATINHLRRLAPFASAVELLAFATAKPVLPVMPLTREGEGRVVPYLPAHIDGVW